MATWDADDLLDRCKFHAHRPAIDNDMTNARWCLLLTEAEAYWKPQIALHAPSQMLSAPVKMTTSDAGLTYTLPGSPTRIIGRVVVLPSLKGAPLVPGSFWQYDADYEQRGATIAMCRGIARTFSDGPYCRYIAGPTQIDSESVPNKDSAIYPEDARILLVYHAVMQFAERSNMLDPAKWEQRMAKAWMGDPANPGDIGILGALKMLEAEAGGLGPDALPPVNEGVP